MFEARGENGLGGAYAALRLYAAARNTGRRLGQRLDTAIGDLLFAVTTAGEKDLITAACYSTTSHTRGDGRQTLFDWEQKWYARRLPPPPARILVPGAGWGREMAALRAQGYTVCGFDPVESSADLRPKETQFVRGDFREWVDAVAGSDMSSPLGRLCETPFDAVILGWSSLSHVLSGDLRLQIFETAAACAPDGPILASFWCRPDEQIPVRSQGRQRLIQLADRLAHLRGLSPDPTTDFVFSPTHGFGVYLSLEEFEGIAARLGREVYIETEPVPRVTLGRCAPDAESHTSKGIE